MAGIGSKRKLLSFDQKIIPDYGFEIITAKPNGSIISEKTKIKLIDEEINKLKDEIQFDNSLKLSDIVGQNNAKNKVKVIVKYLEDPEKFGPWAPKNILFYGLPGTGKQCLSKHLPMNLKFPFI